jgi:tRNA threonylcarbamoyladenosine biosynthesis protein TsaB
LIESDRILVVETSTRRGSIALVESAAERITAIDLDPAVPHDRDLLPAIDRLLRSRELAPRALTGLVLGRGPGSFTGLRVGSSTVLGLYQALGVPVLGRPSLEATAIAALRETTRVAIVLDARRGAFFVARYTRDPSGELREVLAPSLCPGEEIGAAIPPGETVWSDATALVEVLLPASRHPRIDASRVSGPHASELWLAARRAWPPPPSLVEEHVLPLYLRASSPEEKRAQESRGGS